MKKPIDVCARLWEEQPPHVRFWLLGKKLAKRGRDGRMRIDDEALVKRFAEVIGGSSCR